MRIVLTSAIIVNVLSVIMFLIGLFYDFKQPKNKALYGYLIAGCMILYILTSGSASIYGIFEKHYLYSLILFICIISQFVIGKLVTFETLKKYTTAQIIFYVVSLVTLVLKF